MPSTPNLIERHRGIIELSVPSKSNVSSYVVGAATSLTTAFAGTTQIFTVSRGGYFRSRTLKRSKANRTDESARGLTRASFNLDDFASASVPGDGAISFLRVTEVDSTGTSGPEGPILVIPPPDFYSSSRKVMYLSGTAPNVASTTSGVPPQGAMEIKFPKFGDVAEITNSGGAALLVGTSPGMQEFSIAAGETRTLVEAGVSHLFLHGDGATPTFEIYLSAIDGISH